MAEQRRDGAPALENRWWVDTGKTDERTRPSAPAARAPVGSRFFDIGYAFDQEGARTRLSDINLKFLEEARPVDDAAHGARGERARRGDRAHQTPPRASPRCARCDSRLRALGSFHHHG